jgi:NADPH:quinone reductase-like Zn-dependent oxidoreductase
MSAIGHSGHRLDPGGTMKAVLLINHGGPEMLRYGEAPDPIAGPGEVVVDIHAASVNAADYKVRLGGGRYSLSRFPHILGRDFSGVVSALGAGATDFTVGDAVFGVTDQGIEGAYAEKIAIKAAIIAKKPDRLSHIEAAALGSLASPHSLQSKIQHTSKPARLL